MVAACSIARWTDSMRDWEPDDSKREKRYWVEFWIIAIPIIVGLAIAIFG